jgi:hypothetical protein
MREQTLQKTTGQDGDKMIRPFTVYLLLTAIEAFGSIAYTLLIPTDPKNSVFLGYSLPRLVIAGLLLLICLFILVLAYQSWKNRFWGASIWKRFISNHPLQEILILVTVILFLSLFIAIFTPSYRFEKYSAYFERLFPLLIWLMLVSFQTLLPSLVLRFGWYSNGFIEELKKKKGALLASAIVLGILLLIWIIMVLTRVGIQPDTLHWYDNGVPILIFQVMLACGIGFAVLFMPRLFRNHTVWFDILACLLIWLAAMLIWHFQPQQTSYFAPGPFPPNYEFYPYSDAVRYDVAAQNALMGSGYNNPGCPDKPLLLSFLTWLHVIGGLSQERVLFWLVLVLATLPAVLYLLGRELHSRAGGVLVAALVIVKEANAILSATLISTSHSKLMLSEVPQALLLALAALFLIRWIKQPERRTHYIILVGGILGLSILMRLNTLLLVPAVLGIIPLALGRRWRFWFKPGLLLLIIAGITLVPWMWRIHSVCHESPFIFISSPINISVIRNRYTTFVPPTPPTTLVEPPAPIPQERDENGNAGNNTFDPGNNKAVPPPTADPGKFDEMRFFVPAHFLHNLSANIMVLPLSLTHDDLYHTLKNPGSVWSNGQSWDGYLGFESSGLLFINLALLSLGIGFACKRWKTAGVVPLFLALAYFLAAAGARTSGGRYLVPVDWGIILYYSLGLCQILLWLAQALGYKKTWASGEIRGHNGEIGSGNKPGGINWRIFPAVLVVLAVSISIPLTERLFPPYESTVPFDATYDRVLKSRVIEKAGLSLQDINTFIDRGGKVFSGRALYPRYFKWNEGMVDETGIFSSRGFPRTAFILTGPRIPQAGVILPMEQLPAQLPNGADVFVLGCEVGDKKIDALMVVVLQPELHAYTRSQAAPFTCPLPEPVCDDNHVCK